MSLYTNVLISKYIAFPLKHHVHACIDFLTLNYGLPWQLCGELLCIKSMGLCCGQRRSNDARASPSHSSRPLYLYSQRVSIVVIRTNLINISVSIQFFAHVDTQGIVLIIFDFGYMIFMTQFAVVSYIFILFFIVRCDILRCSSLYHIMTFNWKESTKT